MKDRINDDAISGWLIKNLQWEPSDKRSAELVHCDRVELGMPLARFQKCIEALTKLSILPFDDTAARLRWRQWRLECRGGWWRI